MGTIVTDFADQLFSFIALKYEVVVTRKPSEGGPPIESYDWPLKHFSIDIGHAVMMLSYTYRSAFRRHFKSVTQFICSSRETAKLFPVIFAKVTYKCHSPLKILVICAFISEMYLYMYFQTASEDASRRYTIPCINCFYTIYKSVLRKIDDPVPKWNDVKQAASLVARGYSIMEPIMNTEHPSQKKLFFKSVQDVLNISELEDSPEEFCDEATNEPSNKMNLSAINTKYIAAGDCLRSRTANTSQVVNQSISRTSATSAPKSDKCAIGDHSRPRGRKNKKKHFQSSKTRASVTPNTLDSKAKASTNTARLPLQAAMQAATKSGATARADERLSSTISFGTVDQITSKIPGFDAQKAASLEYDHLKDGSSNRETEICSKSSTAKAKSKKHKKRKNSKK